MQSTLEEVDGRRTGDVNRQDRDDGLEGSGSAQTGPPLRAESIWRNRDYMLLWTGQITSILGGQLAGLAYPLVVLALTHSPAKAGLVPIFWMAPFILFGLPAGALVDRWNRKHVMLICDTVRMIGVGMLPIAYLLGHLSLYLVYSAALIEGIGFCFFNLAETAAVSQVVGKSQLPRAMAVNEMGYSATSTVGPGLAGWIMGLMRTTIAGGVLAFAVDTVSYLASLTGIALMRTPFQQERDPSQAKTSVWLDVREGLRFLWGHVRVRTVAFWAAWQSLIYGGFQLIIILIVHRVFHNGPQTIGLLFSAGGAGGIVGAVLAPKAREQFRFGKLLMSAIVVQAVATVALAYSPTLALMATMMFIIQAAGPLWNVTQMSYRLSITPDARAGRVNACHRLMVFAAYPLGSAIEGALLEHMSARLLMAIVGLGALAGVAAIDRTQLSHIV